MNNEENTEIINNAISHVLDTFKFHGISIGSVDFSTDLHPIVNIKISKQKMYRSLEDTLTFAYWTLWTLFYGSYDESKSDYKLEINYKEVE